MELWNFNRGWNDIDGLVRFLRSCKRSGNRSGAIESVREYFLMIAYCRDIVRGKGERDLSYRMIYAFYQVFPVLAIKAVHLLFSSGVGSWCDIKRFCVFISRISCVDHPLVWVVASIANRRLEEGDSLVAKWIPRESRHPELFSIFACDWARRRGVKSDVKRQYRKLCSSLTFVMGPSFRVSYFPFIGEYVRDAVLLSGLVSDRENLANDVHWDLLNTRWKRMLKSFPCGGNGLALVDIDISIPDELLYHAIGYGIMVAMRMGSKRILLMGVEPIWVDLSGCDGFVEMVQLIWGFCEIRGCSQYSGVWSLLSKGMEYVFSDIRLFVFSERFAFDWDALFRSIGDKGDLVLWNLGSRFEVPCDFYLDTDNEDDKGSMSKRFIYMSGYTPGLMMRFFSRFDERFLISNSKCEMLSDMEAVNYSEWYQYFDLFLKNIRHCE
jgi:hypothetical protein